jgi:hemerythrin-like domain-containing protein
VPDGMPFNGTRYAHKWMRSELAGLEQESQGLVGAEPEAVVAFTERLAFFHAGVLAHNEGEEKVLWPALEARVPQVSVPYAYDHAADDTTFGQIEQLLEQLPRAAEPDRSAIGQRLARQAAALHEGIARHSRKEDAHHFPLTEQLFSVPEQGQLAGAMVAHLPPAILMRALPLIFRVLSPDERADYLTIMRAGMPEPAFVRAVDLVRAGLPPADWQELAVKMPGLESL